jgi:hypothetical protein
MSITQVLKSASLNGVISIEKAISIAASFDKERERTKELLKECERNVGMYIGEKINVHLANMDGKTFNSIEYHHERLPGEQ